MSTHITEVHLPHGEIVRINRLLDISSLEDLSDDELIAQGANTYCNQSIFRAEFDDGSSLRFDLCSDSTNYWDDVVWVNAKGNEQITLECEYELDDMEVDINGETYIVKLKEE